MHHQLGSHPRVVALNALAALEEMQEATDPLRAHAEEARALALQVQDRRGLAAALVTQGIIARALGDYAGAANLFQESLDLCRMDDHARGISRALLSLGEVNVRLGSFERATTLLEESRVLATSNGDNLSVAWACRHLGRLAYRQGDLDRATVLLEQALLHWQHVGATRGPQSALYELGNVLLTRGESRRAAARYGESLDLCRNAGDRLGIIRCLEGLAGVDAALGDSARHERSARAARLLGAAIAQREALGTAFRPQDRPTVAHTEATARACLDQESFERAFAEGRTLSLDQAAMLALDVARQLQAADA